MTVVDFHTHILPGIDDGSKDVETSIAMLRLQAELGVNKVVATPHFYANHQSPKKFLADRDRAKNELMTALGKTDGLPEVVVGTEVHFFEGMSDCEYLSAMSIEGTDCVLVEMPDRPWSERNLQELVGIRQKLGLTPIVAHLDRYIRPLNTGKLPERLSDLPVYVQVNSSFFARCPSQRLALRLLREGKIHLLGSDCHDLKHRPPNVNAALKVIERALGAHAVERINRLESKIFNK